MEIATKLCQVLLELHIYKTRKIGYQGGYVKKKIPIGVGWSSIELADYRSNMMINREWALDLAKVKVFDYLDKKSFSSLNQI